MKKKIIIAGVVVVVLAILIFRHQQVQGPAYARTESFLGDIANTYSFTGAVVAPNTQTLKAPSTTTVRKLYVSPNQQVRKNKRLYRLDDGTVGKAEMDGEITGLSVREGDYVTAGRTLAVITDLSRMEIRVAVDEYDVDAVTLGSQVDVTITPLNRSCTGTIVSLDKQGTTTSQLAYYSMTVDIPEMEDILPGMQVEVQLTRESANNVLLLRAAALEFNDKNEAYVRVSDGRDGFVERQLQLGISDGVNVQVLNGLTEGETVYYTMAETSLSDSIQGLTGSRAPLLNRALGNR